MTRLQIFHRSIKVVFIFLCLALVYYQIIQSKRYQQLSQANRIRILPQPASRGFILDRNGRLLAGNTLSYNVLITPEGTSFPADEITRLSSILSIPARQLKSKYNEGYTAPFVPIVLLRGISLSQAVTIGQFKYDLPGVSVQAEPKRIYPLGSLASHVLGYLNKIDAWRLEMLKEYGYKLQDLVGYSGVEEVYDYILHPRDGGMQVEVDNKGRLRRILGFKSPQGGRDIELTIDLEIQKIVYNNLNGHTGCVIILNPFNGDILALEAFPNFNPQVFQENRPSLINSLLNDPDSPLFNRAINGLYPPGSIFKIVVATAGLEKKKIHSQDRFFCRGDMQIGNRKFGCWKMHGWQDIISAIAESCNVFFYNLGLRLGPQSINEYALKLGFNQITGIDLNGESTGFIPYSLWERIKRRQRWFAGDTANMSIGQGEVLVTPIQVARMMAIFANGGILIKPRLLKSIRDGDRIIDFPSKHGIKLQISKRTLNIIKEGLIAAVNESGGTAEILSDMRVSIAGKTGTAQVANARAHGWFVGYFPVEKPRFVICVFLEHVGSGYYCCRLAKNIIEQMLEKVYCD